MKLSLYAILILSLVSTSLFAAPTSKGDKNDKSTSAASNKENLNKAPSKTAQEASKSTADAKGKVSQSVQLQQDELKKLERYQKLKQQGASKSELKKAASEYRQSRTKTLNHGRIGFGKASLAVVGAGLLAGSVGYGIGKSSAEVLTL